MVAVGVGSGTGSSPPGGVGCEGCGDGGGEDGGVDGDVAA